MLTFPGIIRKMNGTKKSFNLKVLFSDHQNSFIIFDSSYIMNFHFKDNILKSSIYEKIILNHDNISDERYLENI